MNNNELVERYIPFAQKIAYHFLRKVPKCVQIDELISAAYMGLVKASLKYDGSKPFEFYAFFRIKGEIQDYLRSLSWGGRSNKIKVRFEEVDIVSKNNLSFDELIEGLSDIDKSVLKLYYQERNTIQEIGVKLGYSNTRIHQILKGSIEKLKAA